MLKKEHGTDIKDWLEFVHSEFMRSAPELIPLFNSYAAEAVFGRKYIDSDLAQLEKGKKILEVGAGSLLLSCQLAREGFAIYSLEPIGVGFSHFNKMRQIIEMIANSQGCCPIIIDCTAEAFDFPNHFEFAFSINVMEHVENVSQALQKITNSLIVGGAYRFTCPNYFFPYEPHFNMPTLLSKRITERALGYWIFQNPRVVDPHGTWRSLNWINVLQIINIVKQSRNLKVTFNYSMLASAMERIASDIEFAKRRSYAMSFIIKMLVKLKIHYLTCFIPLTMQPIIDCRIEKT